MCTNAMFYKEVGESIRTVLCSLSTYPHPSTHEASKEEWVVQYSSSGSGISEAEECLSTDKW